MSKYLAACLTIFMMCNSDVLAQTQLEMNEKAAADAAQIKQQVTKSIRKLASSYATTKGFKNKLDESEELWNNFLEAHLSTIFPLGKKDDYHALYGSMYGLCLANFKADLAKERLAEVTEWTIPGGHKDVSTLQKEYSDADKALNAVYAKVMRSAAKKIPHFKDNLIKAEVAWIAFRDADADLYALPAAVPEEARLEKMTALTRERTQQLNKWITGVQEGDGCAGSYPLHQ
jgi:uncharacterized protein YecT (DUF1311 family)